MFDRHDLMPLLYFFVSFFSGLAFPFFVFDFIDYINNIYLFYFS